MSKPPGWHGQQELQQLQQPHYLPISLQQPVVHPIPSVPPQHIPPATIASN